MGRVNTLFPVSGKVGDALFKFRNHQTFLQMVPRMRSKDDWKFSKKFLWARESALEFAGVSQAAGAIYSGFGVDLRKYAGPYAHNRIARLIRRAAYVHRTSRNALDFVPEVYAPSLVGVDLADLIWGGKARPGHPEDLEEPAAVEAKKHLRFTRREGMVEVDGLQAMADALPLKKGERLETRISLRYNGMPHVVPFRDEMRYREAVPTTRVGLKGLLRAFPQSRLPDQVSMRIEPETETNTTGILVLLVIEWYAMRGHRPRILYEATSMLIAAAILKGSQLNSEPGSSSIRLKGIAGDDYSLSNRFNSRLKLVSYLQGLLLHPYDPTAFRLEVDFIGEWRCRPWLTPVAL